MNVILQIVGGITDGPKLFESEHDALMFYASLAKKINVEFDYDSLGTYSDSLIYELTQAVDKQLEDTDTDIYWWDIEPKLINENNE